MMSLDKFWEPVWDRMKISKIGWWIECGVWQKKWPMRLMAWTEGGEVAVTDGKDMLSASFSGRIEDQGLPLELHLCKYRKQNFYVFIQKYW